MTVTDGTTRTPKPEGGDAASTGTTGTPAPEGRDAQPQGDDLSKLNLEWKGKAESLNALLASHGVSTVEELKEKLSQPPAAKPNEQPTDDAVDWDKVKEFASRGDPVARALLQQKKENEELVRGIGDAFVVRDIPDAEERAEALAHYQRNRHRLGDVQAALAEVREKRYAAENEKLKTELAKFQKPPDPDVLNAPKTHGHEPAQPAGAVRKMTGTQFDNEVATLRASGRGAVALQLQRDYRDGKIEVTD